MLLVFAALARAAAQGAHLLDDVPAPSATSFQTEEPTPGPPGFDEGVGGAIFVAFILSLVGLGLAIWTSIFIVQPLVAKHQEQVGLSQSLTRLTELGD
jgi:hypothetical protein